MKFKMQIDDVQHLDTANDTISYLIFQCRGHDLF